MQDPTDPLTREVHALREENSRLRAALAQRPASGLEDALRESERRYHELADSLPQTVFEMDLNGTLTFTNRNAFDMWGYTPDDFASGLNAFQMLAPEERERGRESIARALGGDSPGLEYTALRKDGSTFPMTIHTVPIIRDGHPVGLRGIIIDITERKQLEEQLLHAQRMEGIGRLAGGIAHDFNNLLTALFAYADLALSAAPEGSRQQSHIQGIRQVGERAASLTHQLLAFARKQVIQPKVMDLNELLHEMHQLLHRVIGEDIVLATLPDADLGRVRVDHGQFEQVLINLAVNARDAMPEGGRLTIRTTNVTLGPEHPCCYPGVAPGDYVMVAVTDTGAGMTEEVRARIFEPFFTTKEHGKGTGLGLATCYGIVKQNGGHICVHSEPEAGTTFRICLPRVDVAATGQESGEGAPREMRGTETVLLAEDEPLVRAMAAEALGSWGYRVLDAADGLQALSVAEAHAGEIDLLVTDVVMPHVGGIELVARLRRGRPSLKVLYISGYSEGAVLDDASAEEGSGFLQKPFTPELLARKVRDLLG